jgi:hypothetical protein
MNLKILFSFLLLTSTAYAENWVCVDTGTSEILLSQRGDCYALGICDGLNNTELKKGCFEATEVEYNKSKESFVKYAKNAQPGSRITEKTQQEIDAILSAETVKKDLEQAKKDSIKTKLSNLGFTDEEINIILSSGN